MKRMIMSFAVVAGLLLCYPASAQSGKGVGQQQTGMGQPQTDLRQRDNTPSRDARLTNTRERPPVSSPAPTTSSAAGNQDTTRRPGRDTMRSPQPVPPVPPVPMPPDTMKR